MAVVLAVAVPSAHATDPALTAVGEASLPVPEAPLTPTPSAPGSGLPELWDDGDTLVKPPRTVSPKATTVEPAGISWKNVIGKGGIFLLIDLTAQAGGDTHSRVAPPVDGGQLLPGYDAAAQQVGELWDGVKARVRHWQVMAAMDELADEGESGQGFGIGEPAIAPGVDRQRAFAPGADGQGGVLTDPLGLSELVLAPGAYDGGAVIGDETGAELALAAWPEPRPSYSEVRKGLKGLEDSIEGFDASEDSSLYRDGVLEAWNRIPEPFWEIARRKLDETLEITQRELDNPTNRANRETYERLVDEASRSNNWGPVDDFIHGPSSDLNGEFLLLESARDQLRVVIEIVDSSTAH